MKILHVRETSPKSIAEKREMFKNARSITKSYYGIGDDVPDDQKNLLKKTSFE